MKKFGLILLLLGLVQFCFADDKSEVRGLLTTKINEVVNIVNNKTLDKETRNSNIVKLLDPIFDFELMAKLSLGKKWFTLSEEDQIKFVDLYVERMKKSYSSKLDAYSGQKIEVTDIDQPKSSRIVLISNLVTEDSKFEVAYKFYKPNKKLANKENWLIYDVEIQGVSILKSDRAQFSEYLQQHSITNLMQELAKKS
jgi:phospholipid transport system substrate-binding protein